MYCLKMFVGVFFNLYVFDMTTISDYFYWLKQLKINKFSNCVKILMSSSNSTIYSICFVAKNYDNKQFFTSPNSFN